MLIEKLKNKESLKEIIDNIRKENKSANLELLEKTIGALFLVECLVNERLDFIFKGGTSLVLLLDEIKRFSVDVDIITEEDKEKVIDVLNRIIDHQDLFTRVEVNVRKNSTSKRMNLQHFKFFFNSVTDNSEKYILLDIAYEDNKYPETIIKRIECSKIKVASDEEVELPSIESILGDKLTVLATKTTGISYDSKKELELMKQLYDVDKLFDNAEDLNIVRNSFINIATRECKYRKLREITYEDVLDDIQDFCEDIILLRKEHMDKINIGMSKMSGFITEGKFLIDKEVLTVASKVLYLVKLIKNNEKVIEKYHDGFEINKVQIPLEYKKRLKRMSLFNEEAYYYIIKSLEKSKDEEKSK